ncbi:MAG: hypothetical protein J6T64_04185, partial [Bacteroidaceae bacterium]|nr:hypothetical protein [Bacteroidaceae bacterium]
ICDVFIFEHFEQMLVLQFIQRKTSAVQNHAACGELQRFNLCLVPYGKRFNDGLFYSGRLGGGALVFPRTTWRRAARR